MRLTDVVISVAVILSGVCGAFEIDNPRTLKQLINEQRRIVLFHSRRLTGECSFLCEEPSNDNSTDGRLLDVCPDSMPNDTDCSAYNDGVECYWGYTYSGCTWDTLSCAPMSGAVCSHMAEGNQWMIYMAMMMPCEIVEGAPPLPEPYGKPCNPLDPLPEGPTNNSSLIDVCPDEFPEDPDCSMYVDGLSCKFFYQYMGCTWDTLACGSLGGGECTHSPEGNTWSAWMVSNIPCDMVQMEGTETPPPLPEGLPWGEPCNPLPTKKGIAIGEGGLIDVCPDEFPEDPDCSMYVDGLSCKFFYQYMGCTWDTLSCGSLGGGECTHSPEGNTWSAWMVSNIPCDMVRMEGTETPPPLPEGLPWGEPCNPKKPLPTGPTKPADGIGVCPETVPEDMDCSEYQDGLKCSFANVYTGCSWESLACTSTSGGYCTHSVESGNQWSIYAAKISSCEYDGAPPVPEGLPWGEECDPNLPLPTPPGTVTPTTGTCPPTLPDGDCSAYEDGLTCSYGYVYMGCDWDTISCGSTSGATCSYENGNQWMVYMAGLMQCMPTPPEGFPFGKSCDPKAPLPTAPPPPVVAAATTPIAQCPDQPPTGDCSDYEAGLKCPYQYMYMGCTWDALYCGANSGMSCRSGSWTRYSKSVMPCGMDGIPPPEGLPFGQACNPSDAIPTAP